MLVKNIKICYNYLLIIFRRCKLMSEKKKSFFFANIGRTALTVVIVGILVAFALNRYPLIFQGIKFVINIVKPFIYGGLIAYLLMPCYNFFSKYTSKEKQKTKINYRRRCDWEW